MPARSTHERATVAVNRDGLNHALHVAGIDPTHGALAAHIGVHKSTVSRVLNGQTIPGEEFIAATLAAFPAAKFEDLFEVQAQA